MGPGRKAGADSVNGLGLRASEEAVRQKAGKRVGGGPRNVGGQNFRGT